MRKLKITVSRRTTLSKELLAHLGVQPGETVDVELLPDNAIQIRAAPKGHISDVFGSLKHRGKRRLSIEEIGRIAADGWAGKR